MFFCSEFQSVSRIVKIVHSAGHNHDGNVLVRRGQRFPSSIGRKPLSDFMEIVARNIFPKFLENILLLEEFGK